MVCRLDTITRLLSEVVAWSIGDATPCERTQPECDWAGTRGEAMRESRRGACPSCGHPLPEAESMTAQQQRLD